MTEVETSLSHTMPARKMHDPTGRNRLPSATMAWQVGLFGIFKFGADSEFEGEYETAAEVDVAPGGWQ